jgi:hypothetical protein
MMAKIPILYSLSYVHTYPVDKNTGTGVDVTYDHNFQRFLPIFGEKFGVFLTNQCYDQIFA